MSNRPMTSEFFVVLVQQLHEKMVQRILVVSRFRGFEDVVDSAPIDEAAALLRQADRALLKAIRIVARLQGTPVLVTGYATQYQGVVIQEESGQPSVAVSTGPSEIELYQHPGILDISLQKDRLFGGYTARANIEFEGNPAYFYIFDVLDGSLTIVPQPKALPSG